ncbi:atp synthase gamma-related [Anaeramoeba ignava]|uniref:Atp synthase gamma-related n=1 Tax=Anaeramoeba ignava TaxID=1746090 RepID=A0A9Q0LDX3_ANAIG|nr:atp synthase gamma-related [Anaeramoeba ignava]
MNLEIISEISKMESEEWIPQAKGIIEINTQGEGVEIIIQDAKEDFKLFVESKSKFSMYNKSIIFSIEQKDEFEEPVYSLDFETEQDCNFIFDLLKDDQQFNSEYNLGFLKRTVSDDPFSDILSFQKTILEDENYLFSRNDEVFPKQSKLQKLFKDFDGFENENENLNENKNLNEYGNLNEYENLNEYKNLNEYGNLNGYENQNENLNENENLNQNQKNKNQNVIININQVENSNDSNPKSDDETDTATRSISNGNKSDDESDIEEENETFPDPQEETLSFLYSFLREIPFYLRDKRIKTILGEHFVHKLFALFKKMENKYNKTQNKENRLNLSYIAHILKAVHNLEDPKILNIMYSEENIPISIGIFEYLFPPPETLKSTNSKITKKTNHREFLTQFSKFHNLIRVDDLVVKMIGYIHKLEYFESAILPEFSFEMGRIYTKNFLVSKKKEVLRRLYNEYNVISTLKNLFENAKEKPEEKSLLILFLLELFKITDDVEIQFRPGFSKNLYCPDILEIIIQAIQDRVSEKTTTQSIEIAMMISSKYPKMMANFIMKRSKKIMDNPLSNNLVNVFHTSNDFGVQFAMFEFFKSLFQSQQDRRIFKDSHWTLFFFNRILPKLFEPIMEPQPKKAEHNNTVQVNHILLGLLCDFIIFCNLIDLEKNRSFLISNSIIQNLFSYANSLGSNNAKLSVVRCFREIVMMNDNQYLENIICLNLFDFIFDILKQNVGKDNMLTSSIKNLFSTILRKKMSSLIDHIKKNYQNQIEEFQKLHFLEFLFKDFQEKK